MTTKGNRRRFTAEEKASILREHLADKVSVSDVCAKHDIQPSVFYGWQKKLFGNLASVLETGARERQRGDREAELGRENDRLKAKLAGKDEVIAEVAAEMVALKKQRGEP